MADPRYPATGAPSGHPEPRYFQSGYPEPGTTRWDYPQSTSVEPGFEAPAAEFSLGLEDSDRISPERGRRRSDGVIVAAIVALVVIAGGMALLDDRVRAPEPRHATGSPPPAETGSLAQPMPELPVSQVQPMAEAGVARPAEPVQPESAERIVEPASDQKAAEDGGEAPEPLPPPTVDKGDPYQAKALAAGLHPGLSRVLLMRLTPEDYANAGVAIRKALAEIKDADALIWPKQPAAGLAQFRVHFVRGAPACRRYVVAISLDRWATTALPMEKCGARLVEPKSR